MRMRPSRNRATDVTGWWQAWSLPMELPGRPPEHARWSPVIFTDGKKERSLSKGGDKGAN
eukprot:8328933-Pyramimonas_sp.AAC.1